ncbi:hypothetical protein AB6A40_002119 [Gnathostoma spinigerum]|uniref:DM domain-containing protein n=1 Tax=Gnathostoma spinigerum TaxID=75299 RepID=A0ABD6E5S5_9BILA
MVEERRRLNNMLSGGRSDGSNVRHRDSSDGKKVRDPKCALCSAHGDKRPLRGHKKARCPFLKCGCHLCGLVENRRTLMARQIKLRRDQQKQRKAQMSAQAEKNISTYSQEGESCSLEPKKLDEPVRVPPLMPTVCRPQPAPFCCANRMITPQQLFPSPIHPPGFRMMPPFDYQFFSPLSFRFNTYFLMPQQYSPSFPVASPLDISYKALNP